MERFFDKPPQHLLDSQPWYTQALHRSHILQCCHKPLHHPWLDPMLSLWYDCMQKHYVRHAQGAAACFFP